MSYGIGPIFRVIEGTASVLGVVSENLCDAWNLTRGSINTSPKPTLENVKNAYKEKFSYNPLNIESWEIEDNSETRIDMSLVEIIS